HPATPPPPDLTRLAELAVGLGAWGDDQQDPADSLWRAARRAFNRGEYGSAANLFGEITRRYAASSYAGDAHYWGAFALYRTGDDQGLRTALTLLDSQQRRYPQARTTRDAATLRVRILTALARGGDQAAAAELSQRAQPPQPPRPRGPRAGGVLAVPGAERTRRGDAGLQPAYVSRRGDSEEGRVRAVPAAQPPRRRNPAGVRRTARSVR